MTCGKACAQICLGKKRTAKTIAAFVSRRFRYRYEAERGVTLWGGAVANCGTFCKFNADKAKCLPKKETKKNPKTEANKLLSNSTETSVKTSAETSVNPRPLSSLSAVQVSCDLSFKNQIPFNL